MAREQFQSLSEQMYYILLALWDEQCGADISRRADELSQGRIRIGPGTLYTLLGRFQEQGMIRETESAGRKRYYVITEKGKGMVYTEYTRLRTLIREARPIWRRRTQKDRKNRTDREGDWGSRILLPGQEG